MSSSQRLFTPLEGIPRRQPHHVTVAVAPLPLAIAPARPSDIHRCRRTSRSPTAAEPRLRGVAPPPSPETSPTVADRAASCPSLGFVPLRGPSTLPTSLSSRLTWRRTAAKIRREPRFVRRAPFRTHHDPYVTARATSSRRSSGSDTPRDPEGSCVVAGHQTPIAVPKNDTGREAPAPPDRSPRKRRPR
jgi:hypothetical protein